MPTDPCTSAVCWWVCTSYLPCRFLPVAITAAAVAVPLLLLLSAIPGYAGPQQQQVQCRGRVVCQVGGAACTLEVQVERGQPQRTAV
jgi:hypothetical protein